MVKSLEDCCLAQISRQFPLCCSSTKVRDVLTSEHKEILLERMAGHHQLYDTILNDIDTHLFSNLLRTVNFSFCTQVNDSFLKRLSCSVNQLESLKIVACKAVTDNGITTICKSQRNLKFLSIRRIPQFRGHSLRDVFLPNLTVLNLKGNDNLDGADVAVLTRSSSCINVLNLSRCFKVNDDAVCDIARQLHCKLEILKLSDVNILTDSALYGVAEYCSNLRQIKLFGCNRVTKGGINALCERLPLRAVDFSYINTFCTGPPYPNASLFPLSLVKVVIRGIQVSEQYLYELCHHCINLEVLGLCGITAVTDKSVKEMMGIRGADIKEIDFSGCRTITDKSLQAIVEHCLKLSKLALCFCDGVEGKPLQRLKDDNRSKQAQSLKQLLLGGCRKFSYNILLDFLPSCANLETLKIAGINTAGDDLLFLLSEHLKKLTLVNLKGCVRITDAGVCELANRFPLRILVLSGLHNLTDHSVFVLASTVAATLTSLYISGCAQITKPAVNYLKDTCNGNLFVEHRVPNALPNQLMARNLDTGQFCRADLLIPNN